MNITFIRLSFWIPLVWVMLAGTAVSAQGIDAPWDWNTGVSAQLKMKGPGLAETSTPKLAANTYITIFQHYISPADGPRCNFYPSCSEYCRLAIRRHGFLKGIVVFEDRFMRDHGFGLDFYPVIWIGDQQLYYDPVSMNDFWWHSEN